MRDSFKVAAWEFKKNIKNKSFLISIFLTPILMIVFSVIPTLLEKVETKNAHTLYIVDEIGIYPQLEQFIFDDSIELVAYTGSVDDLREKVIDSKNTSFMILNDETLSQYNILVYTGDDSRPNLNALRQGLNYILQANKLLDLGLSSEQIAQVNTNYALSMVSLEGEEEDFFSRMAPAIFGGLILISVFITGTMTFQSAIQEKKDKMAEILLSSVSAASLMQGKILGYFVLGLVQIGIWLGFGIPILHFYQNIDVLQYIFVSELWLMLFYAIGGYLLFASVFVAMGATIEDIQSAGNLQGMIFMIPMIPFFLIGAIITNPHGIVARVGSFFPLSTSGVMLFRLALVSRMPIWEILVSAAILIVSIFLVMKLAGKIFKVGILMTGKNATPSEIWKWMRQSS